MNDYVVIVGGGLAGCESAYQVAKRGIKVKLYEMKPSVFSPAHSNSNLAEIVCSNSFKSNSITNACGLLKEELRRLDSLLIRCADKTSVPAGQALAVDRDKFSSLVTKEIEKMDNIEVIREEFSDKIDSLNAICIIATGPLTSEKMEKQIVKLTGEDKLFFYDAAAPIVERDSIDTNIAFYGDRYGKEGDNSYINLPFTKEEYLKFYNELINEVMAKRGEDTIRYGPLKPVGFTDPRTGNRPYALVQLRQDNSNATLYNLVGFQTNLKFGEQRRVFSMIPGLKNAEFVKYGVMHRNTYINSPNLLNNTLNLKKNKNIFFAGQITGVEGYVESISSGLLAGINASNLFEKTSLISFPEETIIGALSKYISSPNKKFQPMNANFGILPPLEENIKDKQQRYEKMAEKSLKNITKILHLY